MVDYQVSAELSTFMDPVPVFASPSARGIEFIFGSEGQDRAKFQFVHVSTDYVGLFSHVLGLPPRRHMRLHRQDC